MPTPAPKESLRLGQWVVALGRTWSEGPSSPPSVSIGVISALGRIWGKAIQTDAKISPVNYGGPLIDLEGRVAGVLVPLSPRSEDAVAEAEWYDSGIGFGSILFGPVVARLGFVPAFAGAAALALLSLPYFNWARERFERDTAA